MKITEYMNNAIGGVFQEAMLSSRLNVKELCFLKRVAKAQKAAAERRLQSDVFGISVPAFLIASVSTECNLHCVGCYARANHTCLDHPAKDEMSTDRWGELFEEASSLGVSFVLLAGGEPLERPDVLDKAAGVKELVFPVFTNGTLFTAAMLERFERNRNLVPVVSMEGGRERTDCRRGKGTFDTVWASMEAMNRLGIFYGVSITVTKDNLYTVTENDFVSALKNRGCRFVILVEYVPADGNAEPALDDRHRLILETRQNKLKSQYPSMIILSFPGDEKQMGGCLAAGRGFFHINAFGDAEPCPFSPYSDTSLKTGKLKDALNSPLFCQVRKINSENREHTGGCALFPRKAEIESFL